MPTVAYIANQCPSPVEPYVFEEIRELRARGTAVIPCSAWRPTALDNDLKPLRAETLYLQPLRLWLLLRAAWLCGQKIPELADLLERVLLQGHEPPGQRLRALLHTWLGAYYALLLNDRRVDHIHAHHGYFSSWVAMVAARLRGVGFSLTLHGSDLLVRPAYLDTKLENCRFCLTVSEFNRRHILERYPETEPGKVIVRRMGVVSPRDTAKPRDAAPPRQLLMLAVGRLHPVKDHAFLVRGCRALKARSVSFLCVIAGEGPERGTLQRLIRELDLAAEVRLLGHLQRHQLETYYAACDLAVLTSRSEGIPLVLMEAMAHGRLVLAPAITGIPELVIDGQTGFLYRAGSIEDFATQVEVIGNLLPALGPLRQAARRHVLENFDRERNLSAFGDLFLARVAETRDHTDENSLLQQI